jgi:hypothetical protein
LDHQQRPTATDRLNEKLGPAAGNRLASRAEFCSYYDISETTAERWARLEIGPRPVKVGPRRVGYRLAEMLAFPP